MIQRAILLVCAVLAAASSLATCHNPFNFEYLDFNLGNVCSEEKIESAQMALMSLRPVEEMNDVARLNAIKDNISKQYSETPITDSRWVVYKRLKKFVKLESPPTEDMTNLVMTILCMYNYPSFTGLDWFASFLQAYGRSKFSFFMWTSVSKLKEEIPKHMEAKSRLDLLFRVDSLSDNQSLETLSAIDLKQFDAEDAIRRITGFTGDKKTALQRFIDYMQFFCRILRDDREMDFNVISLAAAFHVNSASLPPFVKILKEYNRLCAHAKDKVQEAMDEIDKYYEFRILKQTNEAQ